MLIYGFEWYVVLLMVSGGFMIIQALLSLLGGEIDADFDTDADFDFGDFVSFKGFIHYILGFSLTLTTLGEASGKNIGIAAIVGAIFVATLHFLYIFLYKKLSQSLDYQQVIENADGEIYYWNQAQQSGEVFVTLEGRQLPITINGKEGEYLTLTAGDKIKVSGTRNLVYKS